VRASATRVGSAASTPVATPAADAAPAPGTGERPAASSGAQHTAEIGAVVRKDAVRPPERTGVLGSVTRDGGDGPAEAAPAPPTANNGPMMAIGAAVVVLLAIAIGWFASGGGSAPATTTVIAPTTVVAPPTTVAAQDPTPPPTTIVAAPPAEVRVRISVVPTDATITINDVEFPNPMDAMQPRQLTPVRIGVVRDGYTSLERLAIFDSDQNFHFELARGRGVQHVGVTGAEVPASSEGHPPPTTHSGHPGSFREEF